MRRGTRRLIEATALALAVALVTTGCATAQQGIPQPVELARLVGAPAALDVREVYLEQRIAAMSIEQKVAALIMVHVPGTDPGRIRAFIDAHGFAGAIIMGDNVGGAASTVSALTGALSSDPGLPVLTAIDQEGGDVRRLREDDAASARALRGAPPEAAEQAFRERSALVAEAGVLINFGIVADVTPDRSSFIRSRTLGETPAAAAERVAAAVRGEAGNALSTLKHFPGHGASPDDSHVSIPQSSLSIDEWWSTHAVPFQAGIEAGAPLVMMGHLEFSQISEGPASLSPVWIELLRDEMGFDGVIVTDDMLMLQRSGVAAYADPVQNAVRALAAGNDLLLYVLPGDPRTVGIDPAILVAQLAAAVADGRVDELSVDASLWRVLGLRRDASGESGPFIDCGAKCWGESPRASEPTLANDGVVG